MSTNCGLLALSKIKDMKGVSAFTLIHLGKDNGVDLKLFKVKEADLPLVHRPAIFHSENHFEYIQNGEALPEQKWTGYVLTQKSIGRPVSHKEAKTVKGEGPIVAIFTAISGAITATAVAVGIPTGIGGVIGTVGAGALVGAAGGAGLAAITGQPIGKGALGGAAIGAGGAAGSFFGGALGASGITTGATLAGAASGALLEPDNRLGGAIGGAAKGFLAGTGATLIGQAGAASTAAALAKNAPGTGINSAFGGSGLNAAAGGANAPGFGINSAFGGAGLAPAAAGANAPGFGINAAFGSGIAGTAASQVPTLATLASLSGQTAGQQLSSGFGANQGREGFKFGNIGSLAGAASIASIGSSLGPKGSQGSDFDPLAEFSTLRDTLGQQHLPPAVETDLLNTINTPLAELAESFNPANDRTIRKINQAFDLQTQNASRQFAQRGQNFRTSSDARNELSRIENNRAIAIGEAEQAAFASSLTAAIQNKQFALNQSIVANQFDVKLALDLANAIGQEDAFEQAILEQDENQFNTLLAQILNIGFGGQDTLLSQLSSAFKGTG